MKCLPTGHHCARHGPMIFSDLTVAPGIQTVLNKWPARQRTGTFQPNL